MAFRQRGGTVLLCLAPSLYHDFPQNQPVYFLYFSHFAQFYTLYKFSFGILGSIMGVVECRRSEADQSAPG